MPAYRNASSRAKSQMITSDTAQKAVNRARKNGSAIDLVVVQFAANQRWQALLATDANAQRLLRGESFQTLNGAVELVWWWEVAAQK